MGVEADFGSTPLARPCFCLHYPKLSYILSCIPSTFHSFLCSQPHGRELVAIALLGMANIDLLFPPPYNSLTL
jgi:hypothetical protein